MKLKGRTFEPRRFVASPNTKWPRVEPEITQMAYGGEHEPSAASRHTAATSRR
jgi:hypothetical protein